MKSSIMVLKSLGVFGALASRLKERWRSVDTEGNGPLFARFAHADRNMAPLSFSAARHQQRTNLAAENNTPRKTPTMPSIWTPEGAPDQVAASKLLPYMQATLSRSTHAFTSRFMSPTVDAAVSLVQDNQSAHGEKVSPVRAPNPDKLLATSLDLFAMVQVIVSKSDDWSFSTGNFDDTSMERPESARRTGSSMSVSSDAFISSDLATQLRATAEQKAPLLSKNIMIELEKRLERKERCQGFETFLVGIILLNCVEKMSWALQSLSDSGSVCKIDLQLENQLTMKSVATR
ncbi:MAG: hypothetical protein Q9183_004102 [Haloplaca sp. 2 TL-2023]